MKKIRILLSVLFLLVAAVLMVSCSSDTSPYADYDKEGYNVSVKYDANGGTFSTNTAVIVDSYDISKLPANSSGKKEITLVSPDNEVRDPQNTFIASRTGYFLAGWYTEKLPVTDGEGNHLDSDGNIAAVSGKEGAYTYSGRWDFENGTFAVDPSKEYTSHTPVLTLYAAWVPQFSFEFYDIDTGELLDTYQFDPMYIQSLKVPVWNTETGELRMNEFPEVENKTFNGVYLDPAGETPVTDSEIAHTGVFNPANATATGNAMKLYLDLLDGRWYNIYTADQFIKNSSPSGNYNILADLDFTDKIWSTTLMHGNFTGTIKGNGYTFKNINLYQTETSQINTGLFGSVADSAVIENVTFENVTLAIQTGSRLPTASFGLFAGTLYDATLTNVAISGKIVITPTPLIDESTTIGLLCGMGELHGIDITGIRLEALAPEDEYTDPITVTADGNTVVITVG
ncbi:MAG: hypothetical protein IJ515_03695 [Clostridia bacterium]|nr:hypothetical protein [Clostridia bacterium]